MILLGCLLAFGASVAPRLFLLLAWLFSARWPLVWRASSSYRCSGSSSCRTRLIMYMLVWTPRGIEGWDYMWIILGLFLDAWKWAQVWANREKGMEVTQSYYSSSGSGGGSGSTGTGAGTTGTTGTGPTGTGTSATGTGTTGTSATGTGTTGTDPTGSTGGDTPA